MKARTVPVILKPCTLDFGVEVLWLISGIESLGSYKEPSLVESE